MPVVAHADLDVQLVAHVVQQPLRPEQVADHLLVADELGRSGQQSVRVADPSPVPVGAVEFAGMHLARNRGRIDETAAGDLDSAAIGRQDIAQAFPIVNAIDPRRAVC